MVDIPAPDSTTKYIDTDSGKPTKDLFNWMRTVSKLLSGTGAGILSGDGLPCFSAHKNGTNQAGVPYQSFTQITWSTVTQTGGFFASNLWTPPPGFISLSAAYNSLPDGGGTPTGSALAVFKNGAGFKQTVSSPVLQFGYNAGIITLSDRANGTDTYEIQAYVSQSIAAGTSRIEGAANQTWFMGHWISP